MGSLLNRWIGFLEVYNEGYTDDIDILFNQVYSPVPRLSGLFPSYGPKYIAWSGLYQIICCLFVSYHFTLLFVAAALTWDEIDLLAQCIHMTVVCFLYITFIVMLFIKRSSFNRGLLLLNQLWTTYGPLVQGNRDTNLKTVRSRQLYGYLLLCIILSICGFFIIIGGPLIDYVMDDGSVKPVKAIEDTLPIPMYVPYRVSSWKMYLLTCAGQLITCGIVVIGIFSIGDLFLTTLFRTMAEMKVFIYSLQVIEKRALDTLKEKMPHFMNNPVGAVKKEYWLYVERCFVENIEHYKNILRMVDITNDVSGVIVFIGCGVGSVMIALSFIQLLMSRRYGVFITTLAISFGEIVYFYMACRAGDEITNLHSEMRFAVYSIKWYKMPLRFRRYILIMQERTFRPLKINGIITQICMPTFVKIINSAYSYFNVVMAHKRRKTV